MRAAKSTESCPRGCLSFWSGTFAEQEWSPAGKFKKGGRARDASAPSEEKKQDPLQGRNSGDPLGEAVEAAAAASEERRQQPDKGAGRRAPHRPEPCGRPPAAACAAL